ncbi:hypothetical protein MTBSS4_210085 [Magnetospirillum sp. SS-4]|nr:hypothetical protein MTBSS4_210085 [Magnetospirillum sp. SS-4]
MKKNLINSLLSVPGQFPELRLSSLDRRHCSNKLRALGVLFNIQGNGAYSFSIWDFQGLIMWFKDGSLMDTRQRPFHEFSAVPITLELGKSCQKAIRIDWPDLTRQPAIRLSYTLIAEPRR